MIRRKSKARAAFQAGVAAVELAIMLPLLVTLLTAPFFVAVYFWHYSAIHKTSYSAARFLALVPARTMTSPELAQQAELRARELIADGLSDLHPASTPIVTVLCDGLSCGDGPPQEVSVDVRVRLKDSFFFDVYTGDRGLLMQASVRMRYGGR